MGNYIQHATEAFALVQAFQKATVWDTSTTLTPGMEDVVAAEAREREVVAKQVPAYFEQRKPYFSTLLEAMDGILSGSDGSESRWNAAIDSMDQLRQTILGKMLEGFQKPSDAFKELQGRVYEEERVFIEGLRKIEAPKRFGEIAKLSKTLTEFGNLLRGNYKDLLEKLSSINELQETQTSQLLNTLADTSKQHGQRDAETGAALFTAAAKLDKLADGIGKSDGVALARAAELEIWNGIDASIGALDATVKECRWLVDEMDRDMSMLRSAQDREVRGIHPIFLDLRRQATSFVNPTPSERADRLRSDCERAIADAGGSMTAGARLDLNELGGELLEKADDVVSKIKSAYDTFKDENRGRFFDSLSDKTLEEMLKKSVWARRWDRIEVKKIPSNYATMGDRAAKFFDVDLLKAYDGLIKVLELRKEKEAPLKEGDAVTTSSEDPSVASSLKNMVPNEEVLSLLSLLNQRKDGLDSRIGRCKDDLTGALDKVFARVSSSDLKNLYLRSDVESSLKSS